MIDERKGKTMTIIEYLEGCGESQAIKIGAKGGEGFFYIGTAKDFLDNIKSHEIEVNNHAQKMITKAKDKLKATLKSYPTPETFARKILSKDEDRLTAEYYISGLNVWFYEVKKAKSLVDRREAYCEKLVPLSKRAVIEAAESGVPREEGAKRIFIEGKEKGAFWMISEAKKTKRVGVVSFYGDVKGLE